VLNLTTWAARWGVPLEALQDLRAQLGLINDLPAPISGTSEADVMTLGRWLGPLLAVGVVLVGLL
jgi:hypothetical protein